MACCECAACKCHTIKPCCDEGAGYCGPCFCFFSKPRCRFCKKLYDQKVVCPWHWCDKRRQKVKSIGSAEDTVCGAFMGVLGNFLASITLFIILGSAYHRRDGNQAAKGLLSAVLFYGSIGSTLVLGPFAIIVWGLLFISGAIMDWFWPGRCDDCYAEPCFWCCAKLPCFGKMECDPAE